MKQPGFGSEKSYFKIYYMDPSDNQRRVHEISEDENKSLNEILRSSRATEFINIPGLNTDLKKIAIVGRKNFIKQNNSEENYKVITGMGVSKVGEFYVYGTKKERVTTVTIVDDLGERKTETNYELLGFVPLEA